jgi:glycosyltransferase involved in cell wall biosynthesis
LLGVRGDVPDLVAAAEVFVLPSVSEGFPGSLLEAMALQAPAVATDLPGVREALGREGGILVPPRDPLALSRAVVSVLRDPEAGAARASLARRRFLSRFSIQAVADQMAGFYARALGAASAAPGTASGPAGEVGGE